jgi:O-antigen ligase
MRFSIVALVAVLAAWLAKPDAVMSPLAHQWVLTSILFTPLILKFQFVGQKQDEMARALQLGFVVAAGASAFIGLVQYSGAAVSVMNWLNIDLNGGVDAHLGQRNHLASLLSIGLLSIICLADRNALISPAKQWVLRIAFPGLIVLLAFTLAATASRTGAVQMAAIVGAMLMFHQRGSTKAVRWAMGAGIAYLLSVALLPLLANVGVGTTQGLIERVHDANATSRLTLWRNVLELVTQSPLTGHGWRSLAYAHYSADFSGPRFMEMLDNAHNLPLHLAVELGLPVALAFCGAVAWLIWRGKPWNETRTGRQLAWGILMIIGIHSMVEYPLWYGPFFMTSLLCVGVLCADAWQAWVKALSRSAQRAVRVTSGVLAMLLFLGTLFAAFDYHRASQIYLQPEQRSAWYADDPLATSKKSVLFQSHAKFAELQITPLSGESAPRILELSSELVHWSPEPRIIEKLIESATMMQLDDLAAFHLRSFKRAYPSAYAAWAGRNQASVSP